MLAELLSKLEKMAERANAVTLVTIPGNPRRLLKQQGQKCEDLDLPAPLRKSAVYTVTDLIEAVERLGCVLPEIYVAETGATLLLDGTDRRESVWLPFTRTERWQTVLSNPAGFLLGPVDAAKLIRFELQGIGADTLVPMLRKLDFTRTGNDAARAEHGRESWGKAVEASVQQASEIPETFNALIPVYKTRGLQHIQVAVRFGIYLDVTNAKVLLRPLADELAGAKELAEQAAYEAINDNLSGAAIILRGSHGTT